MPVEKKEGTEAVPGFRPDLQKLKPKKIAILGTCPSRMLGPIDDPEWEIWTIGPGGKNNHRWDRLFEIHGPGTWPPGFQQYLDELKAEKPPKKIYVERPMGWPAEVVYPKLAMFEKYGRVWFSSSIAYAMALALEEGVTDLGIYGIDLESGEEYQSQWTGAKYFLTLARLAGVTCYLPAGCGLLRDPNPYPDAWETHLAATIEAKTAFLAEMLNQKRAIRDQATVEILHLEGEINAFNFLKGLYVIHGKNPGMRIETQKEYPSLEAKVDRALGMLQSLAK